MKFSWLLRLTYIKHSKISGFSTNFLWHELEYFWPLWVAKKTIHVQDAGLSSCFLKGRQEMFKKSENCCWPTLPSMASIQRSLSSSDWACSVYTTPGLRKRGFSKLRQLADFQKRKAIDGLRKKVCMNQHVYDVLSIMYNYCLHTPTSLGIF